MFSKIKKYPIAEGLFFALLGVWTLPEALNYHVSSGIALSPALFPILASAVLVGLSLYQVGTAIKRGEADSPKGTITRGVGIVFLLCLLYTAALQSVGFFVTTLAYLVVFLIVLGEKRPAVVILVPLITTGAVYFFFEKALSVMLP